MGGKRHIHSVKSLLWIVILTSLGCEKKENRNTNVLIMIKKHIFAYTTFDWFSRVQNMGYKRPDHTWWSTDMAFVQEKRRQCLLSQFQLLEKLGNDLFANKTIFNIIRFLLQKNRKYA